MSPARIHWAMLDHELDLIALVRSEHFVPTPEVCKIVREALELSPIQFLMDKSVFTIAEWYTWLAFEIPAIDIFMMSEGNTAPIIQWRWERIVE